MKPLFENTTKYTINNYQKFLQFHKNKFSFSYNAYTIIMVILLLYCIILNIIERKIWLFLFFILLLTAFLWLRIIYPLSKYKKSYNAIKNAKGKEQTFTFNFYNHFFTLNKVRFYYFKLFKVYETKDYFYLYVNDDNAALVSKQGFKNGKTSEEFTEFIKKKCMLKYSKKI